MERERPRVRSLVVSPPSRWSRSRAERSTSRQVQVVARRPKRRGRPVEGGGPSFAGLGRILARLAVVAVVLVGTAELGVRAISAHLPPPTTGDTQELVEKKQQMEERAAVRSTEIVFLGNSTMDAGVEPEAFAATSIEFDSAYNAALLGLPLDTQARWFEEVVDPILQPDVAVLGMNPVDVLQSYYTDNELAVVNASFHARFREIEDGPAAALNRTAYSSSYLYRYRGALRAPTHIVDATRDTLTGAEAGGIWSRPPGFFDDNIGPNGAVLVYRDREMTGEVSSKLLRDLSRTLDSDMRAGRIDRLVEQVRASGSDPVVVVPPVALPTLADAGLDADRWREVAGQIASAAAELDVPVVDLSTEDYPPALFSDPIHLNRAGTQRFSFDLARAIDAHCAAGAIPSCA